MSLTVLNVSHNQLSGFLTPAPSGSVFATESVLCCAGPLPEALKLLAPLANLEELSLGGNALGGTITADVAVFKKLKKLDLSYMGLDGKLLSARTERLCNFVDLDQNFVASGRLPKNLANLANLTRLYLHRNKELQVPEGAPLYSSGEFCRYAPWRCCGRHALTC